MPTVPLLASVADLNASVTSGGASQLVPSGVVMAFAGATAPNGWLLCGGALVSRTTYADLFAAIGTAHGSGDGTTTFALPNYAGQFLRGRANGSANDPDRATRTAAASGGNTGDNVGSLQVNATRKNGLTASASTSSVSGTVTGLKYANTIYGYTTPVAGKDRWTDDYNTTGTNASLSATAAAQTITINAGDAETRPLNAYVNYIIKV
jgi:microcystin-dependent protein